MTRTIVIGSLISVLLATTAAGALAQALPPVVSVRPFLGDASHRISADLGDQLSDLMASELVDSGRCRVLDRAWFPSGRHTGSMPPPDSVLDLAADAGVDLLVTGTVSTITLIEERPAFASRPATIVSSFRGRPIILPVPTARAIRQSFLSVRVELVDVKTGRTLLSIASEHPAGSHVPPAIVPALIAPGAPAILGSAALAKGKSSAIDASLRASITELANTISHSSVVIGALAAPR